jgi:hypothetical protein
MTSPSVFVIARRLTPLGALPSVAEAITVGEDGLPTEEDAYYDRQ